MLGRLPPIVPMAQPVAIIAAGGQTLSSTAFVSFRRQGHVEHTGPSGGSGLRRGIERRKGELSVLPVSWTTSSA